MKAFQIFIIALLSCCIIACGGGDATTNNNNAAATTNNNSHAGHDHAGHDHAGHNHDHHGHDHAGHNHAHDNKKKHPSQPTKAEMEALRKEFEEATKKPATEKEQKTADKICACLKNIKTFKSVVNSKTQAEFDKAAGDNLEDVTNMQLCHNTIMPQAIQGMEGNEGGIFAYKTRDVVNKACLNNNSNLWILMGKYISNNKGAASQAAKKLNPNQLKTKIRPADKKGQ